MKKNGKKKGLKEVRDIPGLPRTETIPATNFKTAHFWAVFFM